MSRIHEALKKAEQERAMSQPAGVDTAPAGLEPLAESSGLIATASALSGTAPAASLTPDALLARSRQKAREKQPLAKLLVTSPLPKEGKSFTAANLAQVIVRQHGRRALLIDADLRNPQLHALLGAEPGPGLFEYLQSESDEFSIIQRGPMENLFLIPAGRKAGNPAELVANGRMKFLLSRLEPMFDWIIIDSPPAVLVSDSALLANYCDGVLLVVRSNNTPVDAARRARKEFTDHNVVGVVLNGIAPDLSPYSQYYYKAYGAETNSEAKN